MNITELRAEISKHPLFAISEEFIVAGMSGAGGYNYEQLKLLGVEIPPQTGWKRRIRGKIITREVALEYLDLKGKTKSVRNKEKKLRMQPELF